MPHFWFFPGLKLKTIKPCKCCLIHLQQRNNPQLVPEGSVAFAPKLEEEKNSTPVSVLATAQGVVVDHPETLNRAMPTTAQFPLSVQNSSFLSPVFTGNPVAQLHTRVASSETVEPSSSSRSQPQPLKEEEEDEEVHEGNISVSSVYSQG